jgi:glycosyltransferase involved in cell wall biosynthesis
LEIVFYFFLLAGVIQFFFGLFLLRGIWLAGRSRRPPMEAFPPVSVIFCARNEAQNLRQLIPSLLDQEYPCFEVIAVDDRSDDTTYDYLLDRARQNKKLRVVRINEVPDHIHPKKYALTLGIKAAAYDWLLLTDGDCRPATPRWIASMAKYMDPDVRFVLGCSPYTPQPGWLNRFIRFETLFTAVQYTAFTANKIPYMGVGRNLAYRKSFFMAHNGFNGFQRLSGGDDDLLVNRYARARNTVVCLDPDSHVWTHPKTTWKDFFEQKKRHLMAGKFYRKKHKLLLGLLTGSHLAFWMSGIVLLGGGHYTVPVAIGLVIHLAGFSALLFYGSRKLGFQQEFFCLPLFDIMYAFYYLTVAPSAWFSKQVKWKN